MTGSNTRAIGYHGGKESIGTLKGVGPKVQDRLHRLKIDTVQDLLFHLPLRYQDRTRLTPIGQLWPGAEVMISGSVSGCAVTQGRRRSLRCRLSDTSGSLTLRFFHFSATQRTQLGEGTSLICYGEVRRGADGLEMYHPEYRSGSAHDPAVEQALTPVYPSCEGISQNLWRKLMAQALQRLDAQPPVDLLPSGGRQTQLTAYSLAAALRFIHEPPADADQQQLSDGTHPACQRLALEELSAHYLALHGMRQRSRKQRAAVLDANEDATRRLLATLPFKLTGAQQRVSAEISADLAREQPMLRLVQGDVGSGKTLVAALAALQAVSAGAQVAIMAPTELLAQQHHQSFSQWFEALGISIGWITGRLQGRTRDAQLASIADGSAQVVIGTHALFQGGVTFKHLGLVIIDEQHRFGVHQRLQLRDKGLQGETIPHQLVMTATPIPRTLAMTAYADLDCSVIDELPPGRTPVTTVVIPNTRRAEVVQRVRAACLNGSQVYWVCTLIEESEQLQAQAAEAIATDLGETLTGLNVGLVHGRLTTAEKSAAMASFKAGDLHLLVATTVIEVGVDVPNASLMVIENPERLGLAQLHQLRGRVGRGQAQSHCVLLYQHPLSETGMARLHAMRESNDGFVIAERDLELRGPGEVLGTRQTGMMSLRIADLVRDQALIESARELAATVAAQTPQHAAALVERWIGEDNIYAQI